MKDRKMFKISVALCTYNGSEYLDRQLNSILKQTFQPDEIIIVDDCSTDDTRDIIAKYERKYSIVKSVFNDYNIGSNLSFRKAISYTSNNFIALCDQDDIWYDNKLEVQITSVMKLDDPFSKPLVAYHDLQLIDTVNQVIHNSFWQLHQFNAAKFSYQDLFLYNIVTGCTCLINRRMKTELLKSNMTNIIMHDYLIALIAYSFGTVIYHDQPLMYYRSHSSSVTYKEKINFRERVQSFAARLKEKTYLLPNILQIKEFIIIYKNYIPEKKSDISVQFITLEKKSVIRRIIYKWLRLHI
ncbi:glycosyltransferase family 2 protein [Chryseobacterium salipaludis]|uniref:glycosyltransferase family 2 protein n=1 Tax=Chryseobacterium TaxID=59732 RepID=UPI001FF646A7|nr:MULTISPECIES: glycosyltransferase family 2 protein [Chryseobacterium]MCJ8497157.1 glycosyltransferase family 2 protein [Chryseobacterium salipaludis]MCX3296639.1 glycosyltransferase family 2 protein [Planobacterium sp. JC490]